jgi:ankyrin repeat protein
MQLDGNIDIYVADPDSRVTQGLTGFTLCADLFKQENLEAMKYVILQDIEVPPPSGEEFLEDEDGEFTIPAPKKNIFGESLPSIPIDINLCQTNRANAIQTLCRKSNQLKDQTLLLEVIQLLISRGCDVNNRTTEGMTPLMWCVEYDNRPLARLLLNAKADPRIQDRYHRDCFKLAGKNDALKSFIASYNIAGT